MKRVAFLPTVRKEQDILYTGSAINEFLKCGAEVMLEPQFADMHFGSNIKYDDADIICRVCDLIVVLGGDGSILRASQYALKYDKPLLGINLGRIGYMAELEKDELSYISKIFEDKFSIENRMTLSVSIFKCDGTMLDLGNALNDVIVSRGSYTHCADFRLLADGKDVRNFRADGLIFATPTGSTAYSMAAGGSVLDPTLECICATPVCPISRYACPIIFSSASKLSVAHCDERIEKLCLAIDGEKAAELSLGDILTVKRSDYSVKMLSVKNSGFFETLNNKISQYELKR